MPNGPVLTEISTVFITRAHQKGPSGTNSGNDRTDVSIPPNSERFTEEDVNYGSQNSFLGVSTSSTSPEIFYTDRPDHNVDSERHFYEEFPERDRG